MGDPESILNDSSAESQADKQVTCPAEGLRILAVLVVRKLLTSGATRQKPRRCKYAGDGSERIEGTYGEEQTKEDG